MRRFLILVMVLGALLALTACGGGIAKNDTPITGSEKEVQLAQTTMDESTVEEDVLSQLNTIRSNKFLHLRLSKIAKAQAPADVYFVIAKVDSAVAGDTGTINYNFAYSENNDASTLVEGVVAYNFEWKQENGVYHWVRTGFNVTTQPATKLGTVKGKVINGITGVPVSGVRVYAEGKTNGEVSLSVLTDDNGEYQIGGIVEGDYEIQAYVEQFEVASSGTVQVQGGQTTDVADLKLLPQLDGYKILTKGKVIDGDGNNASGVKVELIGGAGETTITDASGNYTFGMVAAGSYKILVTKRYKEGFEAKQVDVVVTDAEIRAGNNKVVDTIYLSNKAPVVDVVQPAGGSISVNPGDVVTMKLNVTDADSPLASMKYDWQFPVNAVVPVDMSQGNTMEWPTPNVPGTYEIKVVVYDEKGGIAEKKISVTVKNPNVPPVINLTATASGLTATLSGSVTDSDGTVSSVGINWGDGATSSVTTGFDSVSVSHTYLAAGTYTITVTATDNSGGSSSKTISVLVNNPPQSWDVKYEADVLPENANPSWIKNTNSYTAATNTVTNGVLHVVDSGSSQFLRWNRDASKGVTVDPNATVCIETRIKVVSASGQYSGYYDGQWAQIISIGDGQNCACLDLHPNKIVSQTGSVVNINLSDDFHVVRLVKQGITGWKAYVDGNQVLSGSTFVPRSFNMISFGGGDSPSAGEYYLDYLAYSLNSEPAL